MMTAIRGLLSSKKFWSAILGSVIAAVSDHLGTVSYTHLTLPTSLRV